jgi:hypothetical protein
MEGNAKQDINPTCIILQFFETARYVSWLYHRTRRCPTDLYRQAINVLSIRRKRRISASGSSCAAPPPDNAARCVRYRVAVKGRPRPTR